jgi:hypothetical protein
MRINRVDAYGILREAEILDISFVTDDHEFGLQGNELHIEGIRDTATIPVRLCCGQSHMTTQCSDGLVLCCICFGKFSVNQLHVTPNGPEDVCISCANNETTLKTCEEGETECLNELR